MGERQSTAMRWVFQSDFDDGCCDAADYDDLLSLHLEVAEEYRRGHANGELGRTLLTSAHSLHDFSDLAVPVYGDVATNRHKLQLLYLRRGVDALFSTF